MLVCVGGGSGGQAGTHREVVRNPVSTRKKMEVGRGAMRVERAQAGVVHIRPAYLALAADDGTGGGVQVGHAAVVLLVR